MASDNSDPLLVFDLIALAKSVDIEYNILPGGVCSMAKCKNCNRKGFVVETDVNGLCSDCAPYYYLTMQDDLKALEQALFLLARTNNPMTAMARLDLARQSLDRLRSYAEAGLIVLPAPIEKLEEQLRGFNDEWQPD